MQSLVHKIIFDSPLPLGEVREESQRVRDPRCDWRKAAIDQNPHRSKLAAFPDGEACLLLLCDRDRQFVGLGRVLGRLAVRPADFDGSDLRPLAQAEPERGRLLRQVPAAGLNFGRLPQAVAANHGDSRADAGGIARAGRGGGRRRCGVPARLGFQTPSRCASFMPTTTSGQRVAVEVRDDGALGIARHNQSAFGKRHGRQAGRFAGRPAAR